MALLASVEELPPEHPLFGPQAQQTVKMISESSVWAHLKEGLAASREALFASKPISTEDLWRTWGALEALTTLLHQGPQTVLQYSLLAAKSGDDKVEGSNEREYNPQPHRFDG